MPVPCVSRLPPVSFYRSLLPRQGAVVATTVTTRDPTTELESLIEARAGEWCAL